MPNRLSAKCRRAEETAKAHDKASQKLIDLLNKPIGADNKKAIVNRARELESLIKGLTQVATGVMYIRLNTSFDPLSELLDCELSTGFREHLRSLLAFKLRQVQEKSDKKPKTEAEDENKDDDTDLEEETGEDDPPDGPDDQPDGPDIKHVLPPLDDDHTIIPDIRKFFERLRDWIRSEQRRDLSTKAKEILSKLDRVARRATVLMGVPVVAGAIGLFGFSLLKRAFVRYGASVAGEYALRKTIGALSRFENTADYRELERLIRDALDLKEAYDEVQRAEEESDRTTKDQKTVATPRGYAIEDKYVEEVLGKAGYSGLPDWFPAFDAIKGPNVLENGVVVFRQASAVSVKSVDGFAAIRGAVTRGLNNILSEGKWKNVVSRYPISSLDDYRAKITSLRSKALHIIFDETLSDKVNSSIVKEMRAHADLVRERSKGEVKFSWLVISRDDEAKSDFVDGFKKYKDLILK